MEGQRSVGLAGLCFGLAALLSGCFGHPPEIARDVSITSQQFNARVVERFPVGSDETALRAELSRERFVIARDPMHSFQFAARFELPGLCKDDWVILWSAEQGKISSIEGAKHEVCL